MICISNLKDNNAKWYQRQCAYCNNQFTYFTANGYIRKTCSSICQAKLKASISSAKLKGRKQNQEQKDKRAESLRRFYRTNPRANEARQKHRETFIKNIISKGKRCGIGNKINHPAEKTRKGVLKHYAEHPETIDKIREKRKGQRFPYIDSKPERLVKTKLNERGLIYEAQHHVKGASLIDIAFPDIKLAIYVDGCYWHGCPLHNKSISSEAMDKKLKDIKANQVLQTNGWQVIRIWEHQINSDIDYCIERIVNEVNRRSKINENIIN